jgi:transposase-like protein
MYARGLSTRDIEALFADERGRSLLSRTAVSEITERCGQNTRRLPAAICLSSR